jgi:hypothetical protein
MNLSATAKHSMKTHGGYRCKAPSVPYRFVCTNATALMTYNKLYVMGFVRNLNEGMQVWRTEDGIVTAAYNHGGSWVHAEPHTSTDNDSSNDILADVYMVGLGCVGYLVSAANQDNHCCVDFTSDQSDALGFWVNHEGKSTMPAKWRAFADDVNVVGI